MHIGVVYMNVYIYGGECIYTDMCACVCVCVCVCVCISIVCMFMDVCVWWCQMDTLTLIN